MSNTVDSKVVEMRFDNRQFEQNVAQSMSSINKLNSSLQFKGSGKGFSEIDDASKRSAGSLDNFEYAAYKTGFRWSDVLHKISSTAEWRLAQGAVDALERSLKSLADQLLGVTSAKAGFDEYGLKMDSVQTIMASTGESLETVNGYLNELNAYSDRTIYSFSDMTQNIGKFTNAGVSLKDSVAAIQGIANVAALSGANSNEASRAMYNFSQALSAGYVKLMDWKSIENANMATVGFKEQLIETALSLGTITKTSDGMYKTLSGNTFSATKNFNEVLQDQWMTSDVLTKTLANYSDETTEIGKKATQAATEVKTFKQMMDTLKESAQSGWAQTWETIFGDFNEGKALWTYLSESVGGFLDSISKSRNEMLENWKVLGGRDSLFNMFDDDGNRIDALTNIMEALKSVIVPIKEAFQEIFPPMTAERLFELTEGFREFTAKLKLSESASDNLKRVFKGIFAILSIAANLFSAVGRAVGSLFGVTGELSGGILGIAASFGDALVGIRDFIVETDIFYKAFQFVANIIKTVISVIARIANSVRDAFNSGPLDGFVDALASVGSFLADIITSTGDFGSGIKDTFGRIGEIIQNSLIFKILVKLWETIKSIASGIAKTFGGVFSGIAKAFSEGDFTKVFELINGLLSGGVLVGLGVLIGKIKDFFGQVEDAFGIGDFVGKIKEIMDGVTETFKAFQESLKANAIKSLATAIFILAAALVVLSFIDAEDLAKALAAITLLFVELTASFKIMGGLKGVADMYKTIKAMTSIGIALLLMSFALKMLAGMSMSEISRGLIALGGMLGLLTVAQIALSKFAKITKSNKITPKTKSTVTESIGSMVPIAFALLIAAIPLKIMGGMPANELEQGAYAMVAILAAMTIAMIALSLFAKMTKSTSIGSKGYKSVTESTQSLIPIAMALLIAAVPIKMLGSMKVETLNQGVKAMIAILAAMSTALIAMMKFAKTNNKNGDVAAAGDRMKGAAKSLLIMSAALLLAAIPIRIMGNMDAASLEQGVLAMTVILAAMSTALVLMMKFTYTVNKNGQVAAGGDKLKSAAKAMVTMAAALALMAVPIYLIGSMDTASVVAGTLAMAVILGAVSGVMIIMTKFTNFGQVNNTSNRVKEMTKGMILMATALMIVAVPICLVGLLDTASVIEGTVAMIAILGAMAAVTSFSTKVEFGQVNKDSNRVREMVKGMIRMALALMLVVPSLLLLGSMDTLQLLQGVIAMTTIFAAMAATQIALSKLTKGDKNVASVVTSMVSMAAAVLILAPALLILGSMSIGSIVVALVALAGAFTVLGLAAMILKPLTPAITALASSLALIGVAVLSASIGFAIFGAALALVATGLTALAGALVIVAQSLPAIATAIIGVVSAVIVGLVKGLGEALVIICEVLIESLPLIAKTLVELIKALCVVVKECVPELVETLLVVIVELLKSLAEFVPMIVGALAELIVGIIRELANWIPDIVKSVVDVLFALIQGVINALGGMDSGALVEALANISMITLIIAELALISALTPAAMVGVLSMAAIVTELAAVLAILGGLSQIPGLEWLVSEGGNFLQTIGTAIGQFVGGIAGGIAEGFTSALPEVGTNLSMFMTNLQPFIEGASQINSTMLDGVVTLTEIILTLTAANIIEGLTSWLTGGSSLTKFGEEIAAFGPNLKSFADSVAGINPEEVKAAAEAAKALAEMTETIPNSGGVVGWFAGENSVAAWGSELASLGADLKTFADNTAGIEPERMTAVANAAKILADMTESIPNSGGVEAWFAGDNSVAAWGSELGELGKGLMEFAVATTDLTPENVVAAANAAKTLAEMTAVIPNSGGVAAWFAGDNSVAAWGGELGELGKGLMSFANETADITPDKVSAAVNAAKSLVDLSNNIPNSGGIAAWFTGESSVAAFGGELKSLGTGLKDFADETAGITPESVVAAANAAKSLADMANHIPAGGGFFSLFTGGIDYDGFSTALPKLGAGVKGFSDAVAGISPENVTAAANAAKALAEMTQAIPDSGGFFRWFSGGKDYDGFTSSLPKLGKGVKGFSDSIAGMSAENVTAGSNAISTIAEVAKTIPEDTKNITKFGENLSTFGTKVKSYFSSVSAVGDNAVAASNNVLDSVTKIAGIDAGKVKSAAESIEKMITALKKLKDIPSDIANKFKLALVALSEATAKDILDGFDTLEKDMKDIGTKAIKALIDGFKSDVETLTATAGNAASDCADATKGALESFTSAGQYLVIGFANGITANTYLAAAKARAMADAAANAAKEALDEHSPSKVGYEIGDFFGIAFVNAIGDSVSDAYDASYDMAGSARSGLSDAIAKISKTIDGDMDVQPTIRPVLDLSDIRNGVGTISDMLGFGPSVGVLANIGSLNSMMNRRGQNGANDDVVSAIEKLRKDMENVEHVTYNINGVTYGEGSEVASAIETLVRAVKVGGRT